MTVDLGGGGVGCVRGMAGEEGWRTKDRVE